MGKKIGKLSKSMIIRRKPRDASRVAAQPKREAPPPDVGLRAPGEVALEGAGTLVIPRHGGDVGASSWGSAKVVPLHPHGARGSMPLGEDEQSDDGLPSSGALANDQQEGAWDEDRPASTVRRPRVAPLPKSEAEQAAFEEGEATNELLVKALRSADLGVAETLFGRLTGLSPVSTLAVLYDPKGEDLALACRALGMDQLQFVSVYILSRKLGLGEEALAPQDLARLVALFEASDLAEARGRLKALLEGKSEPPARPFRRD